MRLVKETVAAFQELTGEQIKRLRLREAQFYRVPNSVFVLQPPNYSWDSCTVDLASAYLWRLLPKVLEESRFRSLENALAATAQLAGRAYGSLRGDWHELLTHSLLPKGGMFPLRALLGVPPPTVSLQPMPTASFLNIEFLHSSSLSLPTSTTFLKFPTSRGSTPSSSGETPSI